jgi:hypothetical protein
MGFFVEDRVGTNGGSMMTSKPSKEVVTDELSEIESRVGDTFIRSEL